MSCFASVLARMSASCRYRIATFRRSSLASSMIFDSAAGSGDGMPAITLIDWAFARSMTDFGTCGFAISRSTAGPIASARYARFEARILRLLFNVQKGRMPNLIGVIPLKTCTCKERAIKNRRGESLCGLGGSWSVFYEFEFVDPKHRELFGSIGDSLSYRLDVF